MSAIVPAIAKDLAVSDFMAGRINWAYMLPYGLFALLYGPLTRRFHNRHIAVTSLILFAFFSFLSGCATRFSWLFVFRFLVGVAAAATTPLVLIYIADHAHSLEKGKYVGLFFSATFAADLLGIFLSGVLSWRAMFFIPAALGVVTAVLTARYFPPTLAGKTTTHNRYMEAFRQPEILRVFIYIFLISLLYHGVRQWLGVNFANVLRMKQFWISATLTVGSLAGIVGEALGGQWSDKNGRVTTLKWGVLFMAVAVFLMIFMRQFWMLPVLMVLWGFGWTMNHVGLSTFLTDLDKRFIKEVSSLNSSVRFIAGGAGVVLGGLIMQKSFPAGFFFYALFLVAMLLITDRLLIKAKA